MGNLCISLGSPNCLDFQAMLANYGIQTQTPTEVEPVQIWPPGKLVSTQLTSPPSQHALSQSSSFNNYRVVTYSKPGSSSWRPACRYDRDRLAFIKIKDPLKSF